MSTAVEVTRDTFAAQVLAASHSQPVLVDFWAPWCGPCRSLSPVLDQVAGENAGKLVVCKVNTDQEGELASEFGIRGIPAVKLFKDGKVVDEFVGAQPLGAVRAFLERHVRGPTHDAIDEAREHALASRFDESERALAALTPALQSDPRVRAVRATAAFVRIAASPDETDAVQSARVRAARNALARRFDEALEELLAVMARNRRFANAQGREDVVRVFELMAPDDVRIAAARRKLASLLN